MIIPKETLEALNSRLPRGSQIFIANKLNFSKEYVSRVLTGQVGQTIENLEIIKEAQRIFREFEEKANEIKKDLL